MGAADRACPRYGDGCIAAPHDRLMSTLLGHPWDPAAGLSIEWIKVYGRCRPINQSRASAAAD